MKPKTNKNTYKGQDFWRNRIGEQPNSSTSKRREIDTGHLALPLSTKRVYAQELTWIPENDSITLNERSNKTITISGFKLCFEVNNNWARAAYWHYAIVAYKDIPTSAFDTGVANSGSVAQTASIFRDEARDARTIFIDDTRTGLECHCLPLNTDEYHVLTHKKYRLGPAPAGSAGPTISEGNGSSGTNQRTIEQWVPLHRQIRYRTDDENSAAEKLFLIQWCSQFGELSTPTVPAVVRVTKHVVTFFREPTRS